MATPPIEEMTPEQLKKLTDVFNEMHERLQEMNKTFIMFSMAYVEAIRPILQETDHNQLKLEL